MFVGRVVVDRTGLSRRLRLQSHVDARQHAEPAARRAGAAGQRRSGRSERTVDLHGGAGTARAQARFTEGSGQRARDRSCWNIRSRTDRLASRSPASSRSRLRVARPLPTMRAASRSRVCRSPAQPSSPTRGDTTRDDRYRRAGRLSLRRPRRRPVDACEVAMLGFAAETQDVVVSPGAPPPTFALTLRAFRRDRGAFRRARRTRAARDCRRRRPRLRRLGRRRRRLPATDFSAPRSMPPAAAAAPGGSDATVVGADAAADRSADAADGLLINGSVNNGAASPFAQLPAFGNNRRGPRSLYSGGMSVPRRQLGMGRASVFVHRPASAAARLRRRRRSAARSPGR